jgi:hypothetical protein
MAVHQKPDRDTKYMKEMWGTTRLITDYFVPALKKTKKYSVNYCEYFEDNS